MERVPNSAIAHVSYTPSKIPYVGFSPVRLQTEMPEVSSALPKGNSKVKCQIHIPSQLSWFDKAFVTLVPSYLSGWYYQPTGLGSVGQPSRPTGPLLQEGYIVLPITATTTRSASLVNSSRFPRITGYTRGLCPATWYGLPTRPSLLWVSALSIRAIIRTPGGEMETRSGTSPPPLAFLNR